MDFQSEALKILETKTVTEEGNEDIINYLIPIYEKMGAKLILQQVPHSIENHNKRQFNLIGILGDDLVDCRTKKGLLLTTHVDTPAAGSLGSWSKLEGKPWNPKSINGRMYGLGAANAKLDFFCKLKACERFINSDLRQPVYLVASCGGESQLQGSKYLMQSGAVNPKYILVGRPTNLKLVTEHPAHSVYHIKLSFVAVERDAQDFNAKILVTAKGSSGSVAHYGKKQSALDNTLLLIEKFLSASVPMKLFSIHAKDSLNKIPDECSAGFVIPPKEIDQLKANFRAILGGLDSGAFEMRFGGTGERGVRLLPPEMGRALLLLKQAFDSFHAECPVRLTSVYHERDSINLIVHLHIPTHLAGAEKRKEVEEQFRTRVLQIVTEYRALTPDIKRVMATPRFSQGAETSFVKTLLADMSRAGLEPGSGASLGATEAAYFMEKGYDTAVFGPGLDAETNCLPDEWVDEASLQAAIRFYVQAIETFCVRGL